MNRAKKLVSMLLALVMVFTMAGAAMAATSITITGGVNGAEYAAYRLLNVTEGNDDNFAYTLNEKYTDILKEVTGKTEQADIIAYIAAFADNSTQIRAFADAVYAKIVDADIDADATTSTDAFAEVEQGYYLIAETETGDASDTYSLVMLDTAGKTEATIATKEDKPTVDKQVEEKNDTTDTSSWGESADYDIGDIISYKITGTVSNQYDGYKSYYYSFSDTMDAGLTLNQTSIKVMIGDVDVTEQFDIETTEHSFTATANLKELSDDVTITADTKIVVTYTATLNENAVSGTAGNKNEVILKYENNPYHEGDGNPETPDKPEEPGETPKDINIVFTFDAIVNKVDAGKNPLEGAGFTLYKNVGGEWTVVGEEITDTTTFTFEGLDVGKYKLVETTVPAGYNKAADIEFEIVATYDDEKDPVELTGLQVKDAEGNVISEGTDAAFSATVASGEVSTNVVNTTGVELPSTGGVGTTMLYVGGGALIAVAVVMLVAKKRKA